MTNPPGWAVPNVARREPLLAAFSFAYVVGFTIFGLVRGNPETIVYLIAMILLLTVVATIHDRVGFSAIVLWGLAVWGLLHMAGGLIHVDNNVLYAHWFGFIRFDQFVHAFGFGFGAYASWQALRRWIKPGAEAGGAAFIVFFAGMGIGALNEVIEFAITRVNSHSHVGGYTNTGWDLVANLVGSAVAALIAHRSVTRRTT